MTDRSPGVKGKRDSSRPRPVRSRISATRPSSAAQTQLAAADQKVQGRQAPIRRSFINADYRLGDGPAALSLIVKGGRAADVRLRLMLAVLWMAGGGDDRHEAKFPARAWAEFLDLRDPDGAGQRRVRDAATWLEGQKLVNVDREPGRPMRITLLREDGSGKKYISPLRAPKSAKTKKLARRDWSVVLPPTFWTKGWFYALSTPALALLLVLLEMQRADGKFSWVTPELARERFGLSEDTWTRGTRELEAHGLLRVRREPVDVSLGWRRRRKTYRVRLRRLKSEPVWKD